MSVRARLGGAAALGAVGALALGIGLALAYVSRDDPTPVAALVVLMAGNAAVLAGTAWTVRRDRAGIGLVRGELPADGLPPPAWWFPTGATGLVDIAAGPALSGWIGLGGTLLVATATAGAGHALLTTAPEPSRTVVRAARRLRAVVAPAAGVAAAGDAATVGALEPLGRSGVRVVAVGPDGRWTDVVLGSADRARAAAGLAGVELRERTDPVFSTRLRSPK